MLKLNPDYKSRFRILKGGKISLVVSALIVGSIAMAAPSGGTLTSGAATINQTGSVTTINQSTNKASINWQDFSIGKAETVNFVQPSASSVTLNRVIGTTNSLIEGVMNANGQVFLINPNGVLFSKDAQINVGGLVASTLNITDENFQAGNYVFEGNSQNSVLNMGTITATNGGYVSLMGKTVQNEGIITATMGNVQLAGGDKISLNLNGNSLVKLTIDEGTLNALVENKGLIKADGGQVYLTTQALNTILDGMVNNTGIIEAQSLNNVDGKVILFAHGGTANVSGTIDATGGFVETSGALLTISDTVNIKAKEWLLDPANVTISDTTTSMGESGGTYSPSSGFWTTSINAATLISALDAGTSVTVTTTNSGSPGGSAGDITVAVPIEWTGATTLTLHADNNIYINENITASDAVGKLTLEYGQSALASGNAANYSIASGATINLQNGQNFSTKLGSDGVTIDYTVTDNVQGINSMAINLSGNYALGANYDYENDGWKAGLYGGSDWTPIGDSTTKFTGRFDGLGHTVSNYSIPDQTTRDNVGLFGYTYGATIQNLVIDDAYISTSGKNVGALIGTSSMTSVRNIALGPNVVVWGSSGGYDTANGTTTSDGGIATPGQSVDVGGLIGLALGGSVSNITSSASVYGVTDANVFVSDRVGAVIGETRFGDTAGDTITVSNVTVTSDAWVDGRDRVGGIIGYANQGTILEDSTVQASLVAGRSSVGGAVGYANTGTTFENLMVNSTVSAGDSAVNYYYDYDEEAVLPVDSSNVLNGTGYSDAGGLIGSMYGGTLSTSWSDSTVSGNGRNIGGAVGEFRGTSSIDQVISYGQVISDPNNDGYLQGSVGGLVGRAEGTDTSNRVSITNSYTEALVTLGGDYVNTGGLQLGVGGLVGYAKNANIIDSYAWGFIQANDYTSTNIGGLIGNFSTKTNVSVSDSYYNITPYDDASIPMTNDYTTIKKTSEWFAYTGNFDGTYENATYDNTKWTLQARGASVDGYELLLRPYLTNVTPDATNVLGIDKKDGHKTTIYQRGAGTLNDPFIIADTFELQNINYTRDQEFYYKLDHDLDMEYYVTNVKPWNPIGGYIMQGVGGDPIAFNGVFDGDGHTISNLTIGNTIEYYATGLFGVIYGATIKNVNLTDVAITATGNSKVGALVGYAQYLEDSNGDFGRVSTIDNVTVSGSVSGGDYVGGLVGETDGATITNASSSATVTASEYAGGLVGYLSGSSIAHSSASGKVISEYIAGGLVGFSNQSEISHSFATGDVGDADNRSNYVGGLVGEFWAGSLSDSYATGDVYGLGKVGGLIGEAGSDGDGDVSIDRVYATGNVDATDAYAGGLIGNYYIADAIGTISDTYATGSVTSDASYVGGLIGGISADGDTENRTLSISNSYATGNIETDDEAAGRFIGDSYDLVNSEAFNSTNGLTITNSFYSTDSTITLSNPSFETTGFGVGKSAADLKKIATFSGWDIVADDSLTDVYPQLRWATNGLGAGTSVWVIAPTPASTPEQPEQEQTQEQVNNIVAALQNGTGTTPPPPPAGGTTGTGAGTPSQVETQASLLLQQLLQQSLGGGQFNIVGSTEGVGSLQTVTIEELQQAALSMGLSDIRIPLSNGSLIELVNGGVNLPAGITQEFYIIASNTATTTTTGKTTTSTSKKKK